MGSGVLVFVSADFLREFVVPALACVVCPPQSGVFNGKRFFFFTFSVALVVWCLVRIPSLVLLFKASRDLSELDITAVRQPPAKSLIP